MELNSESSQPESTETPKRKFTDSPNLLYFAFGAIIFIIITLSVVGMLSYKSMREQLQQIVEVYNKRIELALKMRASSHERLILLNTMVNTEDPFERDDYYLKFREQGSKFLAAREELLLLDLGVHELSLLEQHRDWARRVVPNQRAVIEMIDEEQLEEARIFLAKTVTREQTKALRYLDSIVDLQLKNAQHGMAQADRLLEYSYLMMALLTLIGIVLSLIVAVIVSRKIGKMVVALDHAKSDLERQVKERTSELEQSNQQLAHLAKFDSLTDLPNRSLFNEYLELFIRRAQRRQTLVALFFIDLDGFKQVNDTYGHDYGDDLLKQVAERLKNCMREEDVVARIGGDEFTAILPDLNGAKGAEEVARRLVNQLSKPFPVFDAECRIGGSVGIAFYPLNANGLDSLVKAADDMMYEVKRGGKGNYRFYSGQVD